MMSTGVETESLTKARESASVLRLTIRTRIGVRDVDRPCSKSGRTFGESDSSSASITKYKGLERAILNRTDTKILCHMIRASDFSSLRPLLESSVNFRLKAGMLCAIRNPIDL